MDRLRIALKYCDIIGAGDFHLRYKEIKIIKEE